MAGEGGADPGGRLAPATAEAYARDWRAFRAFCARAGVAPLRAGPAAVAAWLAAGAGRVRPATLRRRAAAVAHARAAASRSLDAAHPAVRAAVAAGRRGPAERRPAAAPPTPPEVGRIAAACGGDLPGLRDRALVLLGFAAALSVPELAAVQVGDLRRRPDGGLALAVPEEGRPRRDDGGGVREVRVAAGPVPALCPVRALGAWLAAAGIRFGPVFCRVAAGGRVQDGRPLGAAAVRRLLRDRARASGVRLARGARPCPEPVRAEAAPVPFAPAGRRRAGRRPAAAAAP